MLLRVEGRLAASVVAVDRELTADQVCGVFCKNVDKWTTFAAESAVARNPLPGQRGAIPLSGLSVEGQDKAIHNVLPQARS